MSDLPSENHTHSRLHRTVAAALVIAMEPISAAWADDMPALDCLLEPETRVEISSAVPGVLETIHVERADVISEGQPIARLESSVEEALVTVAAARADMSAELESRRTQLAYAQRKLERIKELHRTRSVSPSEKDEAETEVALARFELQRVENEQRLAELELEQARRALNQRTIRSPLSGVVSERYLSAGESVDERPIMRLVKIDPLRVEVIAPVELFGQIEPGMRARVTTEIPALGTHDAKVSVVDPIIDAASGTFGVRLTLPNPDHRLPGGLRCQAVFDAAPRDTAER
jgi:RND family efflux transporter MFP subunit